MSFRYFKLYSLIFHLADINSVLMKLTRKRIMKIIAIVGEPKRVSSPCDFDLEVGSRCSYGELQSVKLN